MFVAAWFLLNAASCFLGFGWSNPLNNNNDDEQRCDDENNKKKRYEEGG